MSATEKVTLDGFRVGKARLAKLLTRDGLAKRSRCSQGTIWRAHNNRPISLICAEKTARALGVPLSELVAGGEGASAAGADSAGGQVPADRKSA